jgi:hypothetical protein
MIKTQAISQERKRLKPYFFNRWQGPLPLNLVDQLKAAILAMYKESHVDLYMSEKGFVDGTWTVVMESSRGNGELWLGVEGDTLFAFGLCGYSKEVDNEPTFVIKQAWADYSIRRTPRVKEIFSTVLAHAKSHFCKHVLIVSSRSTKAYLRWLPKGWRPVSTILKGDL